MQIPMPIIGVEPGGWWATQSQGKLIGDLANKFTAYKILGFGCSFLPRIMQTCLILHGDLKNCLNTSWAYSPNEGNSCARFDLYIDN